MNTAPRSSARTLITLVFGLALIYAVIRYNVFKGVEWIHLPVYVLNKVFALSGLICLSFSYILGNVGRLSGNGSIVSRDSQRSLGLAGLWMTGIHILLSLAILAPGYYGKFFVDGKGNMDGTMNLQGELTMFFGVLGLLCMVFPLLASFPNLFPNVEKSGLKRLLRLGYLGFVFTALHTFFMGIYGWLDPGHWPGKLFPISLIGFVAAVAPLISKGVTLLRSKT